MKTHLILLTLLGTFCFVSCDDDENVVPEPDLEVPATYSFQRDGSSTVSFSGQTTRIEMGEELNAALKDFDRTEEELLNMFANVDAPFAAADLNASDKSIRSKTAASADYFSDNSVAAAEIKADFEGWMRAQVEEVFPNENELAAPGQPGQIADGSSVRYINGRGLEYDQAVIKGLIGALMVDQILNNYLSPAVLDAGSNRAQNDDAVTADGKPYTTMEHKWDEAYGYLYGAAANPADPNGTLGDDSFLNKYLGRVRDDADFATIDEEIFDAFKRGRAAIVAGNYAERDAQVAILRERISELIGIRSVYYLEQGRINLQNGDAGAGFHDLSEGYGFIYSLMFTRKPGTNDPYFTKAEVETMLATLTDEATNGFWNIPPQALTGMAQDIADRFNFSFDEAAN